MINFLSFNCLWQVPNVTDVGIRPRKIKRVAIIGGGLMGSGIATALILNNTPVILKEIDSNLLQKGLKMIEGKFIVINLTSSPDFFFLFLFPFRCWENH